MIALIILGSILLYFLLAKFVINKVYEKTQNRKYKYIAIVFFVVLPFWDVIVGYPVYKYYCYTESGEKIYKTVDSVDGVYVGEYDYSQDISSAFYYSDVVKLFKLYGYVDYRDNKTGKYFRGYKLDTNNSSECLQPGFSYKDMFKNGQCVKVVEIPESDVSRWELLERLDMRSIVPISSLLGIGNHTYVLMRDREKNETLAQGVSILWTGGRLYSLYMGIEKGPGYEFGCCKNCGLYVKEFPYISFQKSILKPSKAGAKQ